VSKQTDVNYGRGAGRFVPGLGDKRTCAEIIAEHDAQHPKQGLRDEEQLELDLFGEGEL